MPKFKNKSGVRLSIKIRGRKGLLFVDAGSEVYLSKQEVADLKDDKYILDSYLELVQNQPKAPVVEEVKVEEAEEPAESPKPKGRGKRR